ncbi:MAG: NTP transferase domain-containing protein [Sphingomonadales bacterium]|nr:NTP transferase domain-containing protein [Sphingomonadales bacterium]
MKGIILAAGRGSRLGEATSSLPKPLLPVGERVCIDFAIEALLAVVSEVIVVTGYMATQVEAHLTRRWAGRPVTAVRNAELEAGNLTSLRAAQPALAAEPFIVTNADHLFPATMYTAFFRPGPDVTIACERDRPILDDEMKVVTADGRLTAIAKTLTRYEGAYIGTTAVGAAMVDAYWTAFDAVAAEADIRTASVEMVLGRLARDPAAAPRLRWIEGLRWYEVDTLEDLEIARQGLLR